MSRLLATAARPRTVQRAHTAATTSAVWRLLATPAEWPRWAPHIRAVEPGAAPATRPVTVGQRLVIRSIGPVAVAATVTKVVPGRRWDFEVTLPGPWTLVGEHEVVDGVPRRQVVVALTAHGLFAAAAWPPLLAYAPLATLAVRRLARLAER